MYADILGLDFQQHQISKQLITVCLLIMLTSRGRICYILYLVDSSRLRLLDSSEHSMRPKFLIKHFKRAIKNRVVRPLLDVRDLIPVLISFL